jgi:putative tricarboxylic transport membrane protein
MDLFNDLALGFSVALQLQNILLCLAGCLLGTVIGVLPGIGPLATISMLLPLTFGLPPVGALIMLAGIYYGSQYGGSTTAILVNLPGEASSTVTMIDGYQMALRGRAGPALAAAGIGSFFAGTVATILVAVVAAPLTKVALAFGPPEYFAIITLGLTSSIALASGSVIKAIAMTVLGLLMGMTGTDIYTNLPRFTFGQADLLDGLDFVAIAVGVFGIGEIIRNLESSSTEKTIIAKVAGLWPNRNDWRRMLGPMVRGTALGSFLGILPGGGALLAAFVSYNVEKKISRNSAEFGKGAIEGVTGPESANNAAAQTSFIPVLSLGLPSNAVMALMVGAMTIQGITPGPNVITDNPSLFWGLIASMWIGNAMLIVLNLPLIGLWVALLRVPYSILFPAIIVFCCIGVYTATNGPMGLYQVIIAGAAGYLLVKVGIEWPPYFLGFVLGPLFEHQLRRTMLVSGGDPTVFFTRPISAGLLMLSAVVLAIVCLPMFAKKREEVFVADD